MLSVGKDSPYQFGERPAGDFFLGKIRRLYLPYAFFSVLSWLFYLTVLALEGKNGQFARQVPRIASLITGTARNGGNERIRVIGHLNHLGANSLIILGTHKPLLHLVRKAAGPLADGGPLLYQLSATALAVLAVLPLVGPLNRHLPWALGRGLAGPGRRRGDERSLADHACGPLKW